MKGGDDMGIPTEIARIKTSVAAAYAVLEGMGATMPDTQNVDNLAATVLTVPTGGSCSCAYNLLDNTDFTNPVNSNGETSYSGAVDCIDRWQGNTENTVVDIAEDGVIVTGDYLKQALDRPHIGKTLTICARSADGTVAVASCTVPEPTADAWLCTGGAATGMWVGVMQTAAGVLYAFICNDSGTAIQWAALYEGEYTEETLPKYIPKGYAVEELNCGVFTKNGVNVTELWTNASDTSTFAAQTIALDLSDYDALTIYYKNKNDSTVYLSTGLIPVGRDFTLYYMTSDAASQRRAGSVSAMGVTFGTGYAGSATSDACAIPVIIYGHKGITGAARNNMISDIRLATNTGVENGVFTIWGINSLNTRAAAIPIAQYLKKGKTYKFSLGNASGYSYGVDVWVAPTTSMAFEVPNNTKKAYSTVTNRIVNTGWRSADYEYTPTVDNCIVCVNFKNGTNTEVTEADRATLLANFTMKAVL